MINLNVHYAEPHDNRLHSNEAASTDLASSLETALVSPTSNSYAQTELYQAKALHSGHTMTND